MNFKSMKYAAAVAVIALGISGQAQAQTPVLTNITTNSAITIVDVQDIEFGTWFLIFRNADAFSLNMTTAGVSSAVGLGGGAADSQAIELVAGTGEGQVTVDLPVGLNNIQLNMQRDAIVDFADAGLTLTNTTYGTATEGANVALATATNVPVTVVNGGTPEVVSFGADIAVSATPADAAHSASFNVTFAY
jgi:hypothetical protein